MKGEHITEHEAAKGEVKYPAAELRGI